MKPVLLLVEPNMIFRSLLKHHLGGQFYIVEKDNYFGAINWIEQQNIPDLIICSSQLDNLYGPDFIKIVRLYFHKNAVPIMMTTAQMHYGERADALLSGANAYFPLNSHSSQFNDLLKLFVSQTLSSTNTYRSVGK